MENTQMFLQNNQISIFSLKQALIQEDVKPFNKMKKQELIKCLEDISRDFLKKAFNIDLNIPTIPSSFTSSTIKSFSTLAVGVFSTFYSSVGFSVSTVLVSDFSSTSLFPPQATKILANSKVGTILLVFINCSSMK